MIHSYHNCADKKPGDKETCFTAEIECLTCIDREIKARPGSAIAQGVKNKILLAVSPQHLAATCECGAEKCKTTTHASWCPKH